MMLSDKDFAWSAEHRTLTAPLDKVREEVVCSAETGGVAVEGMAPAVTIYVGWIARKRRFRYDGVVLAEDGRTVSAWRYINRDVDATILLTVG